MTDPVERPEAETTAEERARWSVALERDIKSRTGSAMDLFLAMVLRDLARAEARANEATAERDKLKTRLGDMMAIAKGNAAARDAAEAERDAATARAERLAGESAELRGRVAKAVAILRGKPKLYTEVSQVLDEVDAALALLTEPEAKGGGPAPVPATFQAGVGSWMDACFGPEISADRIERNHRFLEEALELVQANGCTQSEAHQLVDYVYGRDQGEINQEVGGVMVTLAALCLAIGVDMNAAAEAELARVWTKIDKIRAKQAAKPKHSPLPSAPVPATTEKEPRP